MATFTAIAWRHRSPSNPREGWFVSRVLVASVPAGRLAPRRAEVVELTTGRKLSHWDQLPPYVMQKPKSPLFDMVTVEDSHPTSWTLIPEKELPNYLETLRTQRDRLHQDRKWHAMGEIADIIQLLEPWLES